MEKPRKANTDKITMFNTWYSKDIKEYKRFAKNKSNAFRYSQEYLTELTTNIVSYLKGTKESGKPLTIAGFYRSMNIQKKDYYKMKNGDFDWKLYQFMDFNNIQETDIQVFEDGTLGFVEYWLDADGQFFVMNTYSEIIEKALLVLEMQAEERLLSAKSNSSISAAIFILKAKFGWSDKPDTNVLISNSTMNVANKQEADRIFKLTLAKIEEERKSTDNDSC